SIGDDLTVLAAVLGLARMRWDFIQENAAVVSVLIALYLIQLFLALWRYGRISTFHTYLAKAAAVVTAIFLLVTFFFEPIVYPLFWLAVVITALDVIEEIMLVLIIKEDRS